MKDIRLPIFGVKGSALLHVNIEINGTPVDFVIDTGSDITVITIDQMRRLGFGLSDLKPSEDPLSIGCARVEFKVKGF